MIAKTESEIRSKLEALQEINEEVIKSLPEDAQDLNLKRDGFIWGLRWILGENTPSCAAEEHEQVSS